MRTYLKSLLVVGIISGSLADKWKFPNDGLKLDSKIAFGNKYSDNEEASDESKLQYYKSPAFRDNHQTSSYASSRLLNYNDGTLDSIDVCKCAYPDSCDHPQKSNACPSGKYLCCLKRNYNREYDSYNDIGGKNGPAVLVGPEGPTGIIGPNEGRGVLVGPDGPTGVIGPGKDRGVLVGPDGPTGIIGPSGPEAQPTAQRGVLVGPGGPTGIIGPGYGGRRPVLVGPGGPTGVIGPYRNPGVLVGPGGPTGIIGPATGGYGLLRNPHYSNSNYYNRPILSGPGGPTGHIGPGYYRNRDYEY